jgi:hypothetical protein
VRLVARGCPGRGIKIITGSPAVSVEGCLVVSHQKERMKDAGRDRRPNLQGACIRLERILRQSAKAKYLYQPDQSLIWYRVSTSKLSRARDSGYRRDARRRISVVDASLRYCAFEQIWAGHSGQNTRTRPNHFSSMARNRLGREYPADPNWAVNPLLAT